MTLEGDGKRRDERGGRRREKDHIKITSADGVVAIRCPLRRELPQHQEDDGHRNYFYNEEVGELRVKRGLDEGQRREEPSPDHEGCGAHPGHHPDLLQLLPPSLGLKREPPEHDEEPSPVEDEPGRGAQPHGAHDARHGDLEDRPRVVVVVRELLLLGDRYSEGHRIDDSVAGEEGGPQVLERQRSRLSRTARRVGVGQIRREAAVTERMGKQGVFLFEGRKELSLTWW